MTIDTHDGYTADGDDQLKDQIISYFETEPSSLLQIGDDVVYTEIYRPCYRVPNWVAKGLKLGTSPSPTGEVDLSIAYDSRARFDTSRINILEA